MSKKTAQEQFEEDSAKLLAFRARFKGTQADYERYVQRNLRPRIGVDNAGQPTLVNDNLVELEILEAVKRDRKQLQRTDEEIPKVKQHEDPLDLF